MNKNITTKILLISLTLLSVASVHTDCLAASKDDGIQDKREESRNQDRLPAGQGLAEFLRIEDDNENSKINYAHIFGLFLDFGRGNISLEEFEAEIEKRISICREEEEKLTNEWKNLIQAKRNVWEKVAEVVARDKKRFSEKKVSIEDLKKKYGEVGQKWFTEKYGIKTKATKEIINKK